MILKPIVILEEHSYNVAQPGSFPSLLYPQLSSKEIGLAYIGENLVLSQMLQCVAHIPALLACLITQ